MSKRVRLKTNQRSNFKVPQKETQRQIVEQSLREGPSRDYPPSDPSHIQLQKPDTIIDAFDLSTGKAHINCEFQSTEKLGQQHADMLTFIDNRLKLEQTLHDDLWLVAP